MKENSINWIFVAGLTLTLIVFAVGMLMGYLNIRRARGPREKRHVRLACFAIWGLAMVFLAAMLLLDSPYREIVGGALFLLIPLALFRFSTRHQLIRKIEAREQRADPPETP